MGIFMKSGFLLVSGLLMVSCGSNQKAKKMNENVASMSKEESKGDLDQTIADWPAGPRLAVQQMSGKYGEPLEVSSESVVWHNAGPFSRITVTRRETPHSFPLPHMDYLEHTISYKVPAEKVDDLVAFDGSTTVKRTEGELSARCDLESHNVLTLNLARDIIEGKTTVDEARRTFGQVVVKEFKGMNPAYVTGLQFQPQAMEEAIFVDEPVIPGSPKRGVASNNAKNTDAEALAFVVAADQNEILAAMTAEKKDISKNVKDYAKMLHKEHGMNAEKTMKLAKQIGSTPINTAAVDEFKVNGKDNLSQLVPLEGKQFEKAYIGAMIKNHEKVLAMIDNQLIPEAKNEALTAHLKTTRDHVAMHLDKAKKIQKEI